MSAAERLLRDGRVKYQKEVGGFLAEKAREISARTGRDVSEVLLCLIRLHNEVLEEISR